MLFDLLHSICAVMHVAAADLPATLPAQDDAARTALSATNDKTYNLLLWGGVTVFTSLMTFLGIYLKNRAEGQKKNAEYLDKLTDHYIASDSAFLGRLSNLESVVKDHQNNQQRVSDQLAAKMEANNGLIQQQSQELKAVAQTVNETKSSVQLLILAKSLQTKE
jgi:hypothetical protein